ncbi:hypothetical protein [Rossellomorea sp. SC111]|uniref:hypothetical protein n=1 Tax=Rossellomorea sp. SC111 TaxID=2968985 RepID=UPI00215B3294|nr:hypothetical protein [Rossellomorea sp. SC111]
MGLSGMSNLSEDKDLKFCPENMQTTDELIHWVLSVLSSIHLTEEQLVKWWGEEIQFAIPHTEAD